MTIQVKNCMEDFVIDLVRQMLKFYPHICKCDQCLSDITAWSLNHLPPKYVGTDLGDTYTRLDISQQDQYTATVKIIAQAIALVTQNPRHPTTTKNPDQE